MQRMRAPHWQEWRPMREICEDPMDEVSRLDAIRAQYSAIAAELTAVGVDVNCAPVLDVPQPNAHPIIGDRAFGAAPGDIAVRAREAMAGLLSGGSAASRCGPAASCSAVTAPTVVSPSGPSTG